MNFKLKGLVAALALSTVAMSAQAEIAGGSNSELFFSAWDGVRGYTFDLTSALALNDIVGGADLGTGSAVLASNNALTLSRIPSYIGAGVVFDGALTGFNTAFSNASAVEWNLSAYDNAGRRRLISTQDVTTTGNLAISNAEVGNATAAMSLYTAQADSVMTDMSIPVDSYAITLSTDGTSYAGNTNNNWVSLSGDTTNLMGVKSGLSFFAQATTVADQALGSPLFAQLGLTARTYQGAGGEWRLELAGAPAVAAVPEPESYAMMLAGLALLGGAARRRNNKA